MMISFSILFRIFRKLSFVVDYNQADAFAGHNQFFEGLTLFHASADEKTLGQHIMSSIIDTRPEIMDHKLYKKI